MTDRVELNAENLESIVGGAFHYSYNNDGTMICYIDDTGSTYNCSPAAKDMLSAYILQHDTCTLDEVIGYALTQGLFW